MDMATDNEHGNSLFVCSTNALREKRTEMLEQLQRLLPGEVPLDSASDALQAEEFDEPEGYRISPLSGSTSLRMLFEIQEQVARTLALRLHDESAQLLAAAYLELADIASDCPDPIVYKVKKVVSRLDNVCEQLRRLSHELRPLILDQLGLMPALQFLASGVRTRSGLNIVVSGQAPGSLPKNLEIVLYRVVQESLNNVVRHAGASRVDVTVSHSDSRIFCSIKDNGIGLKPLSESSGEVHGLGLVGIHERVASVEGCCRIVSSWGKGWELQVEMPL